MSRGIPIGETRVVYKLNK